MDGSSVTIRSDTVPLFIFRPRYFVSGLRRSLLLYFQFRVSDAVQFSVLSAIQCQHETVRNLRFPSINV